MRKICPSRRARSLLPALLAASALASGSFAASAADLPAVQPPEAPAASWAGFYAGSAVGWSFGSFRSSQTAARTASQGGVVTGTFLGWQFETKPFVYGVEGEIGENLFGVRNPGVAPGLAGDVVEPIDTVRLRARLGYDLGDFMPFVAGGVAMSQTDVQGTALGQFGQKREQDGLSLGAGLEWRLGFPLLGPTTLRLEYIYDAYPATSFAIAGGPVRVSGSTQTIRLGLVSYPGAALLSGQAASADAPDWSGAYGGVLGGGAWSTARTSFGGAASSTHASGPLGGVFVGRNFAFGRAVLGVEGSTSLENVSGSGPQPGVGNATYRDYLDADLRGRAGWAFGRFLPYVTAGVDWSHSQQTDPVTGSSRNRVGAVGLALGGGLEYMWTDRWSTRVEYLHESSFGASNTGLDGLALSQTRRSDVLRAGLAYYFH